jgi:hypothetical protein
LKDFQGKKRKFTSGVIRSWTAVRSKVNY